MGSKMVGIRTRFYNVVWGDCGAHHFLFRELKSKTPLLQLRLFRYRNYVASALIAFIFGAGMFGLYILFRF